MDLSIVQITMHPRKAINPVHMQLAELKGILQGMVFSRPQAPAPAP